MSLITSSLTKDAPACSTVRAWAQELWAVGEDGYVMVTELRCLEPACPPHETVVLIARSGAPAVHHKLPKPAADIVRADLHALVSQELTT